MLFRTTQLVCFQWVLFLMEGEGGNQ